MRVDGRGYLLGAGVAFTVGAGHGGTSIGQLEVIASRRRHLAAIGARLGSVAIGKRVEVVIVQAGADVASHAVGVRLAAVDAGGFQLLVNHLGHSGQHYLRDHLAKLLGGGVDVAGRAIGGEVLTHWWSPSWAR